MTKANQTLLQVVMSGDFILNSTVQFSKSAATVKLENCYNWNVEGPLRAQLYGLGYPRQPSPRATLAEVTFSLFLSKIQPAVYIRIANSSRGARQLG